MHLHKLHSSSKSAISAPPRPASRECLFCGSKSVTHGYCSSCDTHFPTARSDMSVSSLHKRGLAPRKSHRPEVYEPGTDGCLSGDVVSSEDTDELAEYAAELDALEVDISDDDQDSDSLPPLVADSDNLPWD